MGKASLVSQTVKNLPAIQETRVPTLDWEDPWRRKCQPTLVFLPGKFHGERSLEGHSPWGHKELDTNERLTLSFSLFLDGARWLEGAGLGYFLFLRWGRSAGL